MVATDDETGRGYSSMHYMKKNTVMSAQKLEVSIRSRNGAPSPKGCAVCAVNGQMTKASNK